MREVDNWPWVIGPYIARHWSFPTIAVLWAWIVPIDYFLEMAFKGVLYFPGLQGTQFCDVSPSVTHDIADDLNQTFSWTKKRKAVLKSACQAILNDTKTSSLAHRVIIPLVKPMLLADFTWGIMTLWARDLVLVSFKPAWHADFRTAFGFLVHEKAYFLSISTR